MDREELLTIINDICREIKISAEYFKRDKISLNQEQKVFLDELDELLTLIEKDSFTEILRGLNDDSLIEYYKIINNLSVKLGNKSKGNINIVENTKRELTNEEWIIIRNVIYNVISIIDLLIIELIKYLDGGMQYLSDTIKNIANYPRDSRNLVLVSPSSAYRNADNWGFFIEQYDISRHKK